MHDAELALFGTSLGVDLEAGAPVAGGHRHHMRAINAINRAGGIRGGGRAGVLTTGVMVECVRAGVDFVLAGSIRDDGPIVDTITDIVEAQERYAAALEAAGMVIVLSTMLHGIGVGNMLPAWVPVVCVDINPAVVTKLADRGSSQTIGIVTDVGLFLHQLARQLPQGEPHQLPTSNFQLPRLPPNPLALPPPSTIHPNSISFPHNAKNHTAHDGRCSNGFLMNTFVPSCAVEPSCSAKRRV